MKISAIMVPSVLKVIMGDYGHLASAALEWGSSHKDIAIEMYDQKTGCTVYPCGFFISDSHSLLGASPDGLVLGDDYALGLIEKSVPPKYVP